GVRGYKRVTTALIKQDPKLPNKQPNHLNLGRHVGDHELNGLVLRYGHAELDPFLRVAGGELECRLPDSDGHRRDARPRAIKGHHSKPEAVVLLAQQVALRHLCVLELDLSRVRSAMAELVLFLQNPDSWRLPRYYESRDF